MKRHKIVILIIALVIVVLGILAMRRSPSVAATVPLPDTTAHVKAEAQKCAQAILDGDFETMYGLLSPRLVTYLGGKDAMLATFTKNMAAFKARGIVLEDLSVQDPEPIQQVESLQISLVPYQLFMKTPASRVAVQANLLGVSEDRGSNWSFVDLSGNLGAAAFFKLYPELSGSFTFPAQNKPVVESTK